MDFLGGLVLLASRADERNEERRLFLAGHALLEQLNQFENRYALLRDRRLDLLQGRQGKRVGRASARSRGSARGSAVARRTRLGLEAEFL